MDKTTTEDKVTDPTICIGCGSKKVFSPVKQALVCEHCGNSTTLTPKSINDKKNRYYQGVEVATEESNFTQYKCGQCNSTNTFFGDDEIKRCPSCGAYDNLTQIHKTTYKIDGIIPFKISREQASTKLTDWIKTRKMVPNDFRSLINKGKVTGLYYPAYIFDANGSYQFSGTYQTAESIKQSDGTMRTIYHQHSFSGNRQWTIVNHTVSASSTMADSVMQNLTNFNLDGLIEYELPFVAGFPTNEANISVGTANAGFHKFLQSKFEGEARQTAKGQVINMNLNHYTNNESYQLALLPIWVTYYTYKGKNYNCYINGHSGSVVGKHPKSFWKSFFRVAGILAIMGAIAVAGAKFLGYF
jgi:DNA-directed RNA polymerase subunit RPC12/RpoP